MSVRAALDAARAVFAVSRGEPAAELSLPPADATGSANDLSTTHARAVAMWSAAEEVLRALLETPTLSGQALVGEARKRHWLDLSDAHALVALQGAADRAQELSGSGLPTIADDEEHALANDAWRALESAAERALPPSLSSAAADGPSRIPSRVAPSHFPPTHPAPPRPATPHAATPQPTRTRSRMVLVMALVLVTGTIAALLLMRRSSVRPDLDAGVAAYGRGARDVARQALARDAREHPGDARPLIFLGRIARDENDLITSRRLLDAAVRAEPTNALAHREYAATQLASGLPELARRFYVRALELAPDDRLAQGFLACTLHRLGRADEAQRWASRAGDGEWTPCLSAPVRTRDSSATALPP
ncbi:MAG: hypothetical protein KA154_11720 [Gemmatimonadaceae bacterium]|nr:hypothetical protein [Gemmatimonadaceae bacterium]MCC6430012.1 hypothetical protein [Gemmatimonadaceae bacterium]